MGEQEPFYSVADLTERLSISTLVFYNYRPVGESALEELVRHGITRIELLECPGQFNLADARSMKVFGGICRSCGVEVASYHAMSTNFSDLDTEAARIRRVDHCRRQIDTMLELGGVVWGSHAGAADETLATCCEELARHVEGTPAVIAIENFTGDGVSVDDRMAFLDRMDHPQLGFILDIGHVRDGDGANPMIQPGGPARVIERCAGRLRHLHLHGFKDGDDHFPPFVDGDGIQWAELFRSLRAHAYPGDINFEPISGHGETETLSAVAAAPDTIVNQTAAT